MLGFEFKLELNPQDQTDGPGGHKFGDEGADAANLAWHGVKTFCFPNQQPRGAEQAFTMSVSADDRTTGTSAKFYVAQEKTMNGLPDGPPEIDARLVHKWREDASQAPLVDGMITHGGHVTISKHQSELDQVVRELHAFPQSLEDVREFLKDATVWQLVGDKCSDKVARLSSRPGWFLDPATKRAGFCMHKYSCSLDEKLSTKMVIRTRFDKCEQVLQIMIRLQEEFPFLMFPDIKPNNFLCFSRGSSHSKDDDFTIVLSDLDDVRRTGSIVSTHTTPYRHPTWTDNVPTTKIFEQYAVTVTLLQILLNMTSQVLPASRACLLPTRQSPCPEQLRRIAVPSHQTAPCVQVAERQGHAWNPIDYVEHFTTTPAEVHDQHLDNLRRDTNSGPIVIDRIKEFFKGEDGYLMTTQLPGSGPLYLQMKDKLAGLRVEAINVAQVCSNAERWPPALAVTHSRVCFHVWQRAATSASARAGFMINGKHWQMTAWQEKLLIWIKQWEEELDMDKLRMFHFPYVQGKKDLKASFETLRRAVGNEPSSNSRKDMVARVRAIAETILRYLICNMHGNAALDLSTLQGTKHPHTGVYQPSELWGEKWPNHALEKLRFERDNPTTRQLNDYYHTPVRPTATWKAKGTNNIDRLCKALHFLRNKTNDVRHPMRAIPFASLDDFVPGAHTFDRYTTRPASLRLR